jgi:hypothetical protein
MRHSKEWASAMNIFLFTTLAAMALATGDQSVADGNCQPLPAELSAWNQSASPVSGGMLVSVGKSAMVRLEPTETVVFVKPPERNPDKQSFSGTLKISIAKEGLYRLIADRPVWLDVVAKTGIKTSISHQHGPRCSDIHKMVDYKLANEIYNIQISGSTISNVKIMMIRLR